MSEFEHDLPKTTRFSVKVMNLHTNTTTTSWFRGNAKSVKHVGIYVRQSKGDSTIESQTNDCINNAKSLGFYSQAMLFQDNGSAWKDSAVQKLYGLQRLFTCIRKGYIKVIIIYDTSRLSRNIDLGNKLLQGIRHYNLTIYSVFDNKKYTSDPFDCYTFHNQVGKSYIYSVELSKRLKDTNKHLKEKGYSFGKAKYGMKAIRNKNNIRTFVVNNDEQKIIGMIKNKYKKKTNKDTANLLNKGGYVKRGKAWTMGMVSYIFNNKFDMTGLLNSLEK